MVALHPEGGGLYLRRLSADLSGWADEEWSPVQGPSAELRLRDFVQVRDDEAALLLADEVGVSCRTVGLTTPYLNDDFVPIRLNSNFGIYAGAIGWPHRNELIAFATPVGETRYGIVEFDATQTGIPDSDPAFEVSGIAPIGARLRDEVGVSLDDPELFRFEGFKPFLQVPKNIPNLSLYAASLNPLNFPNTEEIVGDFRPRPDLEPFSGTLYDLLTLSLTTFEGMVGPFDNEAAYIQGADKVYYLIQYRNFGIKAFIEALDELTDTDPFGTPPYWWTFLDAQIMRLTEGRFGVRGLIRQAFHNVIADDMVDYGWDPDFDEETASPIAFIERISDLDISGQLSAGTREIRIASTAGHDHLAGASNEKPVAIWKQPLLTTDENGTYWTLARRSGGTISAVGDQRITPNTCPSFSILPPEDMAELADRRDGSELVYTRNADGPPSIQGLLRERFFIIPVMLGDALCAAGFYDEAQRWFRSVYHAGGDPGARKIDYGLVLEESRPLSFNAIDDWLRDPGDVHAVALGRRESDTRRVLLSIVACLVA